jgi:hypothetical protein
MTTSNRFRAYTAVVLFLTIVCTATGKYSGGTGEPNDPYQIATAADLIALGETPGDYDKHFLLTADIDLDPNLPGGKVFDRAVIAPDRDSVVWHFQGTAFSGVFDGNGHRIANLTIAGHAYLGLFGLVAGPTEVEVRNLGLVNVKITGVGVKTAASSNVGGLAGCTGGCTVTNCHSTGAVSGAWYVGGLVGESFGPVSRCYSIATVTGWTCVGGLLGYNSCSAVSHCYSTGAVSGGWTCVGGLIGQNSGSSGIDYSYVGKVTDCYSTSTVLGVLQVGGLVGWNDIVACLADCYATGSISGEADVGGLVGCNAGDIIHCSSVGTVLGDRNVGGLVGNDSWCFERNCWIGTATGCFWDTQTSGQTTSAGGTGKTTAEMQTPSTFLDAGWDFAGETANGSEDIWKIVEGQTYPLLSWQKYSGGTGEPNDPYLIYTPEQLNAIGTEPNDWGKHFKLMNDVNLSGFDGKDGRPVFNIIAPAEETEYEQEYYSCHGYCSWSYPQGVPFTGVFDGNGHAILNFTYASTDTTDVYIGLFGYIDDPKAQIKDLALIDPNVTRGRVSHAAGGGVGCLVGCLERGTISGCSVRGGHVKGEYSVGGLVGSNGWCTYCCGCGTLGCALLCQGGTISNSYTAVSVYGTSEVGGLVGSNNGPVTDCYATGVVDGNEYVGGLVGVNSSTVTNCYSTGDVTGRSNVGGLVGGNDGGSVTASVWDTETSRRATSAGGTGKTTAQMQMAKTFLDAGWDFVGETANGTEDIWWILEGKDYPRLWWEAHN